MTSVKSQNNPDIIPIATWARGQLKISNSDKYDFVSSRLACWFGILAPPTAYRGGRSSGAVLKNKAGL
ncbi:MAG: hypothetical protein AB9834_04470 [Lentimicrobium sp.]